MGLPQKQGFKYLKLSWEVEKSIVRRTKKELKPNFRILYYEIVIYIYKSSCQSLSGPSESIFTVQIPLLGRLLASIDWRALSVMNNLIVKSSRRISE